ncbi:MAG: HAMP domain-containing protein, partial [Anaerolineae bacterium]
MFWKSLSIRWRMVLILVVLPLLLLLPGFLFVGVQYRNAYRDARLGKGEILARQVEQSLVSVSPYISSVRDLPALDRYLGQSIEDEPEMAFAAVVRDDGFVLYHSVPGLGGTSDPVLSDVDPDTAFQEVVVPYTGLREVYLVSREIALEMEEDRSFYVVIAEYADLVDPPFLTWVPALAGIALALLLVILLQAGLSRLILAPLEQVAEGAALIGAGDLLYRIKVRGTDEIAFLARRFNDMARQLHSIVTTLEQQVTERTDALAQRSEHLEAVARVAREAVQVHNVPLLLDTTVNAISDHFGYYHTGIFLTDDEHEWAVLSAASSEGGQRMLARRHRLRVGEQGIVGTVTATGEPRIALDVGQDAVWFDTP